MDAYCYAYFVDEILNFCLSMFDFSYFELPLYFHLNFAKCACIVNLSLEVTVVYEFLND
ncbi:Uncharacterized protein TCM_045560 [Theobroma cacao]|uniref:Uncharacterized protein n=1 Tax=Theobroma cacao TaxID=3641 RepID=A0A061FZI3_THECC|nr:Uncharacterized protein TCM_045560 [Theobroma cacao]